MKLKERLNHCLSLLSVNTSKSYSAFEKRTTTNYGDCVMGSGSVNAHNVKLYFIYHLCASLYTLFWKVAIDTIQLPFGTISVFVVPKCNLLTVWQLK